MKDLAVVKTYGSRMEAEIDRGLLLAHSLESIVSADDCGGVEPNLAYAGGVKLLIRKKDLKKAREILGK